MRPSHTKGQWLRQLGALALGLVLAISTSAVSIKNESRPDIETDPFSTQFEFDSEPAGEPNQFDMSEVMSWIEPNVGQTDSRVKFVSRGKGYQAFLTDREALLVFPRAVEEDEQLKGASRRAARPADVIKMRMVGANGRNALTAMGEELSGEVNYLTGNDESQWLRNIPTYKEVRQKSVYRGIDLVYRAKSAGLEYDFVVAPGADHRAIRLEFDGADEIYIDTEGDLILRAGGGELRQSSPAIYQDINGEKRTVDGGFVGLPGGGIGFSVRGHDRRHPVTIDPVLSWSTFLGGAGSDFGNGIAIDQAGDLYLTGIADSGSGFPTVNPFDPQGRFIRCVRGKDER